MGGEVKTNASNDFKAMETEMNVRHEGTDRVHKSLTAYIKSISKKSEGEDKEKSLPIANLGGCFISHGEEFDTNSNYGQCLIMFGRAEERIGRIQESYASQSSSAMLEPLERSLAQLREYQASRKKLDQRRLAYDTSQSKVQKAKKEDFRVEEEVRVQKAKYEESNDDVCRRMHDIKETDEDAAADLAAFLDAQLEYYDKCREVLLQLKNDWPGAPMPSRTSTPSGHRYGRTRSNTAHSFNERVEPLHEEEPVTYNVAPARPTMTRSGMLSPTPTPMLEVPVTNGYQTETNYTRPTVNRTSTFEGPMQLRQDYQSPAPRTTMRRTGSVSSAVRPESAARPDYSQLRPIQMAVGSPQYEDVPDEGDPFNRSTPDLSYGGSASSQTSQLSPSASSTALNGLGINKKGPPPPPPSRAKKPPPPPPPMKRPSYSTLNM